ncbi:hypothetical protein Tco_0506129 [Tanacetum coccineum]
MVADGVATVEGMGDGNTGDGENEGTKRPLREMEVSDWSSIFFCTDGWRWMMVMVSRKRILPLSSGTEDEVNDQLALGCIRADIPGFRVSWVRQP